MTKKSKGKSSSKDGSVSSKSSSTKDPNVCKGHAYKMRFAKDGTVWHSLVDPDRPNSPPVEWPEYPDCEIPDDTPYSNARSNLRDFVDEMIDNIYAAYPDKTLKKKVADYKPVSRDTKSSKPESKPLSPPSKPFAVNAKPSESQYAPIQFENDDVFGSVYMPEIPGLYPGDKHYYGDDEYGGDVGRRKWDPHGGEEFDDDNFDDLNPDLVGKRPDVHYHTDESEKEDLEAVKKKFGLSDSDDSSGSEDDDEKRQGTFNSDRKVRNTNKVKSKEKRKNDDLTTKQSGKINISDHSEKSETHVNSIRLKEESCAERVLNDRSHSGDPENTQLLFKTVVNDSKIDPQPSLNITTDTLSLVKDGFRNDHVKIPTLQLTSINDNFTKRLEKEPINTSVSNLTNDLDVMLIGQNAISKMHDIQSESLRLKPVKYSMNRDSPKMKLEQSFDPLSMRGSTKDCLHEIEKKLESLAYKNSTSGNMNNLLYNSLENISSYSSEQLLSKTV